MQISCPQQLFSQVALTKELLLFLRKNKTNAKCLRTHLLYGLNKQGTFTDYFLFAYIEYVTMTGD